VWKLKTFPFAMAYKKDSSDDAYYPTLSWQPLAYYSACPETLKDMSDL
ncbi:hypothetical protein ACUOA5_21530, partial [Escherichia coli]